MSTSLKQGTFCKPSTECERYAILELGRSLNFHQEFWNGDLATGPYVSWGMFTGAAELSCADFIAAMYAEAERRKGPNSCKDGTCGGGVASMQEQAAARGVVEQAEDNGVLNALLEFRNEADKRIEGLEKALNEHMVNEREEKPKPVVDDPTIYQIPRHFHVEKHGEGVNTTMMVFDPKASPAGIPFEVALAYLKAGRRIRHYGWSKFQSWGKSDMIGSIYVDSAQMLGGMWEVIPETAA